MQLNRSIATNIAKPPSHQAELEWLDAKPLSHEAELGVVVARVIQLESLAA